MLIRITAERRSGLLFPVKKRIKYGKAKGKVKKTDPENFARYSIAPYVNKVHSRGHTLYVPTGNDITDVIRHKFGSPRKTPLFENLANYVEFNVEDNMPIHEILTKLAISAYGLFGRKVDGNLWHKLTIQVWGMNNNPHFEIVRLSAWIVEGTGIDNIPAKVKFDSSNYKYLRTLLSGDALTDAGNISLGK